MNLSELKNEERQKICSLLGQPFGEVTVKGKEEKIVIISSLSLDENNSTISIST